MRAVLQRVTSSKVVVDGETVGSIKKGLNVLLDVGGEILLISQFTLYGDCRKGRRPNFMGALGGDEAKKIYDEFVKSLKETGIKVETGIFGAHMDVSIENDGPVTLIVESKK